MGPKLDESVEIRPKSPDVNLETGIDVSVVRYTPSLPSLFPFPTPWERDTLARWEGKNSIEELWGTAAASHYLRGTPASRTEAPWFWLMTRMLNFRTRPNPSVLTLA